MEQTLTAKIRRLEEVVLASFTLQAIGDGEVEDVTDAEYNALRFVLATLLEEIKQELD